MKVLKIMMRPLNTLFLALIIILILNNTVLCFGAYCSVSLPQLLGLGFVALLLLSTIIKGVHEKNYGYVLLSTVMLVWAVFGIILPFTR